MYVPARPVLPEDTNVTGVLDQARKARAGRRWRAWAMWSVLGVTILAAGSYWWAGRTTPQVSYATAPVARGDLTVTVTATGSLHPTNEVEVSSELSGTVRAVLVDYNSVVSRDQELAELDTDKLQAAAEGARAKLAAAQASVAEARATIAEKKSELDRKTALHERNVSSAQEVETAIAAHARAVASLASADATVQVAKADLHLAEVNLAKACICSPIDGVVLSRDVEPGQTVAASLQAPVLFTIAEDLSRMELRVDVDEADVGGVEVGQAANFTVDAYPGRSFPATIRVVRFASETVQGVVTYKAILDVDNADLALRPGMTATADIVVSHVQDEILVPNQSLRWAPEEAAGNSGGGLVSRLFPRPPRGDSKRPVEPGARAVYVLRDGEPARVPVEIGPTDGENTVVRGALAEGDLVVTESASRS